MCEIEVTGMAFLWHQVRCMSAILFLIGYHHEKPEVKFLVLFKNWSKIMTELCFFKKTMQQHFSSPYKKT